MLLLTIQLGACFCVTRSSIVNLRHSAAGWAPMSPLATTAFLADLNLMASDQPGNIRFSCN
jgi:hypothetical protein